MPRKKRMGKKVTRRRYRRYTRRVPRPVLSGFPKSKLVKLRYVETDISLNAGISGTANSVFRANSAYDPDYTFSGHQPMGYDQWAAIYSRYTVLGSKITIRPTPTGTGSLVPMYYGITLSGSANVLGNYTSINNILESKLTTTRKMVNLHPVSVSNNGGKGMELSKTFSAKKFFGVKDVQDGAALSALVNDNPAKDAFFGIWTASINGNDPDACTFMVQVDYIVLFREPTNLDGST